VRMSSTASSGLPQTGKWVVGGEQEMHQYAVSIIAKLKQTGQAVEPRHD